MNGNRPEPLPFRTAPLYRFEECRNADLITVSNGIPEIQLMGQAALSSLNRLIEKGLIRGGERGSIHILCGSGNNGGDGLALAYHLLGIRNFVYFTTKERLHVYKTSADDSAPSRFYESLLIGNGVPIHSIDDFPIGLHPEDIVVEALLGTGQSGSARGGIAEILKKIAFVKGEFESIELISLDIPAGLSEEGSDFSTNGYRLPDEIHSYGTDKVCLHMHPELKRPKLILLPIGLQPFEVEPFAHTLPTPIGREFYHRSSSGHKYEAGHGLLIGGFRGMEGAAILSTDAFFATGGGIMHHASDEEDSRRILLNRIPSAISMLIEGVEPDAIKPAAIAIGPGISREALGRNRALLLTLIGRYYASGLDPHLILDASASALVLEEGFPAAMRRKTLLTPHSGEWRALGGPEISCTRDLESASEFVREQLQVSVYLKGPVSVLFHKTDEGVYRYIRNEPSSALSVAGSGDVLTGALLALFSRRKGPHYIPHMVGAAADLLLKATSRSTHPRSDRFPDLIRSHLERHTR